MIWEIEEKEIQISVVNGWDPMSCDFVGVISDSLVLIEVLDVFHFPILYKRFEGKGIIEKEHIQLSCIAFFVYS